MSRIGIVLIVLLTALTATAQTPHDYDDKKIRTIDAGKKYTIERLSADELRKSNSSADTTVRVVEVVSFSSKKNGLEKVVHRTRFQGNRVKRTTYFGGSPAIFAIRDSIVYGDKTRKVFTYYLSKREFAVTDENHKDVTATIDRDELYEWILSVFPDQIIGDRRNVR